jgi:hypothetical protein
LAVIKGARMKMENVKNKGLLLFGLLKKKARVGDKLLTFLSIARNREEIELKGRG